MASSVQLGHFAAIVRENAAAQPATLDTWFQPVVSLDTLAPVAYEALSRPPRGSAFGSVQELFDHARSTGQLPELDRACWKASTTAAVRYGFGTPFSVLVNIEPESFGAGLALSGGGAAGAPAGPVAVVPRVIELTERALLAAPGELPAMIDRVRALGHAIALDDLGADPASLALLPLIDPDVVKLDLRLIQERPDSEVARIMSALNTHLARRPVPVIAEGIETERQLVTARALGATHAQGWLFGRPGPAPAPAVTGALAGLPVRLRGREPRPAGSAEATPFEIVAAVTGARNSDRELLVQLSVFLEARARAGGDAAVVLSTFQEASNITPGTQRRYARLVEECALVMAHVHGPGGAGRPDGGALPEGVRVVPIRDGDPLLAEWDIVVVTADFAAVLVARELDPSRHAEGVYEFALSHDRELALAAAGALLRRAAHPEPSKRAAHPAHPAH
jgi:EAL domain-containing protein (putative c-di-GMP-specific phosphodiesterase class I)